MRSVALDLGRKISFCEVANGEVQSRATARSIDELERHLAAEHLRRGSRSKRAERVGSSIGDSGNGGTSR